MASFHFQKASRYRIWIFMCTVEIIHSLFCKRNNNVIVNVNTDRLSPSLCITQWQMLEEMYITIVHVLTSFPRRISHLWHYADDVSLYLLVFRESRSYQQKDIMAVVYKISKNETSKGLARASNIIR